MGQQEIMRCECFLTDVTYMEYHVMCI